MLRIVQNSVVAAAKRYYTEGLAQGDYYLEGDSHGGTWGGKGAKLLGLVGEVDRAAFNRLCENRRPDGDGEKLTARMKAARRVGYDINFHCPKSVSILYAFTKDPAILAAFRAAASEAMNLIEADVRARVRAGNSNGDRKTGNLIWAEFVHFTARPVDGIPDPHLHLHCFTFNATFDEVENRWKAVELGSVKADAGFFEAVFHSRLALGLVKAGYAIENRGKSWEVAAVPQAVVEKFSSRTAEIERVAERQKILNPKRKDALGARTRRGKSEARPWDVVEKTWRGRLTGDEFRRLFEKQDPPPLPASTSFVSGIVGRALASCFERGTVVSEKAVLEAALRLGIGRLDLGEVSRALADSKLDRRVAGDEKLVTSPDVLAVEREVVSFARGGRGTCPPLASLDAIAADVQADKTSDSIRRVLSSPDRVILLRGENESLRVSRATIEALQKAGHTVLELGSTRISCKIAERSAGRSVENVSSFLSRGAAVEASVVWIHGAGKLGIQSLSRLFALAKGASFRVVLAGEMRKASISEKLDTLRVLEDYAGLRSAEIDKARQLKSGREAAIAALTSEKYDEACSKLEKLGLIREVKPDEIASSVAAEFVKAARGKRSAVVLAPGDRKDLTEAVRSRLRASKVLGRPRRFERLDSLGLSESSRGDASFYKRGQVVVFFKSVKGFRAGQRYVVVGRDPFGHVLARKGAWVEALPLSRTECFNVYRRSSIELSRGDMVRITCTGRTLNERFGPEKLLSKRRRAIRFANHKLFGVKTPDRRYRVPKGAVHRVTGFTLLGDIRLENGWVLPKGFGHLDYGYCVGELPRHGLSAKRVLIVNDRDHDRALPAMPKGGRNGYSVTLFTDDKSALLAKTMNERPASSLTGDAMGLASGFEKLSRVRAGREHEKIGREERSDGR